ncbi:hypothetical protein FOBRF1_013759 [Fusarium oxysporum]
MVHDADEQPVLDYWKSHGGRTKVTGLQRFHVFHIIAERFRHKKREYEVPWVGYSREETNWPLRNGSRVLSALLTFVNKSTATNTQRVMEIAGINTSNVTIWDCPSTTSPDLSQSMIQTAMNDFAYTFYTEKDVKRAFERYVASNYVQHNPSIPDGRDAAIKILSPLFGSKDNTFEIARVMVGPEYTTIHIKAGGANDSLTNVFDVYRTKGSCIVEHWDCLQAMEKNTTSHHPYF